MSVHILIREDQNEHGYIDTSVVGVFQDKAAARQYEESERHRAQAEGLVIEDDDTGGDWQVCWRIEEYTVM